MNKEQIIAWAKENPVTALAFFGVLLIFIGVTINAGITTGIIVLGVGTLIAAFIKMMVEL